MACSGGHCNNHGTGYSTCAGHRYKCPANRILTTTADVSEGAPIEVAGIEELRQKIRAELTKWNGHANHNFTLFQPTAYTTSTIITDNHVEELMFMVDKVYGGSGFGVDKDKKLIEDTDWAIAAQSVYKKYEIVRQDCICNSDCACNNVCLCNNDCSCNYSDIRLKKDVRLLH
jgi:hypothetical protein